MGTTARYTFGASRLFNAISASQALLRRSRVVKSRKPKSTGFFTFHTASGPRKTQEAWVSISSRPRSHKSCRSVPMREQHSKDVPHPRPVRARTDSRGTTYACELVRRTGQIARVLAMQPTGLIVADGTR